MKKIKILWIEDDLQFPPSVIFRVETELTEMDIELEIVDTLPDGKYVWDSVRDLKPDIIMMDHNLQDVLINGANLVTEIRFHDNETPIIFYSSEMGEKLINLVKKENRVFSSTRADVHSELMRLIQEEFTSF